MFFIHSKWFFKYFARKWVNGLALYPFILCKKASLLKNERFITHEKIHLKQQLELFILPFFAWYIIEYSLRLVQFKGNANKAYRNISFEKEAYMNENDPQYLKKRRFWSFLEYMS